MDTSRVKPAPLKWKPMVPVVDEGMTIVACSNTPCWGYSMMIIIISSSIIFYLLFYFFLVCCGNYSEVLEFKVNNGPIVKGTPSDNLDDGQWWCLNVAKKVPRANQVVLSARVNSHELNETTIQQTAVQFAWVAAH